MSSFFSWLFPKEEPIVIEKYNKKKGIMETVYPVNSDVSKTTGCPPKCDCCRHVDGKYVITTSEASSESVLGDCACFDMAAQTLILVKHGEDALKAMKEVCKNK